MTRHRDFGAGKSIEEFDELGFTLGGEQFVCKPAIQGKKLLKFITEADSKDGGRAAEAIYSLFQLVMEPESYERFMELLESEDHIFELTEIGEIASWLVEQYTARPTQQPTPSQSGRRTSGRTPTAVAS